MSELIHDLALSIVMAWILGVAAHLARQPLILAYLVAGFVIGPSGLKWVQSQQSIKTIAELGLIFMLFMIGLEIDLKKIIRAGNVILVTSAAQISGCFALGLGLFLLIGIPLGDGGFDAVYLAAAVSLSSTVIIVKVLYDKFELDTLPGRITLGVLVVQDLTAILFLAIQPSLHDLQIDVLFLSVVRVGALLAAALLISRYTLPHLFQLIAHLPELVLVGAIAWCFAVAELAEFLGLSRVMGALIAGVSLSTFPYAVDVTAKVTSLRDFFITLFFVALGMQPSRCQRLRCSACARPRGFHPGRAGSLRCSRRFTPCARGCGRVCSPPSISRRRSEFSLVLVQIGAQSGHTTPGVASAASTAFVVLAVVNTFVMMRSDAAPDAPSHSQAARVARPRSRPRRER